MILHQKVDRGSHLHLKTLTGAPDCATQLTDLLHGTGIVIRQDDHWQPHGEDNTGEMDLPTFLATYCPQWPCSEQFRDWWAPYGGRLPQWDLIATCTINGQPGLLLVEGKAHERELSCAGKRLPTEQDSSGSRKNHMQIELAISQASTALNTLTPGFTLSSQSHYQLANRLAWAWKAAMCGIPVALIYLGFIGDTYFADPFHSSDHWQRIMGGYLQGVVPQGFPERQHTINDVPLWFVIRSMRWR